MKKVSIIVPVYNCEKYLSECLDSLVRQTYENYEIILINDGSTDNSLQICSEYSKKNNKIKLISIKNNGVSNARNTGIKAATGDYISFVDSDDEVEETFISSMVNKINLEKIDLVAVNYKYWYVDNLVYNKFKNTGILSADDMKRELFDDESVRGFSCNKLFRLDIISKYNILFNTNIKICEDLLFCYEYLKYCNQTYVINDGLYLYRMRKSSASNHKNEKDLTVFDAFDEMFKLDRNVYTYGKKLYTYVFFKYKRLLKSTNRLNEVNNISNFNMIFDKNINIKEKIRLILFQVLNDKSINKIKIIKQKQKRYFE